MLEFDAPFIIHGLPTSDPFVTDSLWNDNGTIRLSSPAPPPPPPSPVPLGVLELDVRDFGAVCDGVADDTAALRAAILAADTVPAKTLVIPGVCRITDTLIFGGRLDRYSTINMRGQSEYTTGFVYTGPMDRPAILISHMAAFTWSALSVSSPTVTDFDSHGTAVGILIDGPSSSGGTMNTTFTFDHVLVSGFYCGIQAGGGDAASEMDCRQVTLSWNDIGFVPNGYNSLNFWFYGLSIVHNRIGVKWGGPGASDGVHVKGGSSAGNTVADFYVENPFGVLSIEDFRAEIAAGAYFTQHGSVITLRQVQVFGVSATAPVIWISGTQFSMEDSIIFGQIDHPAVAAGGTVIHMTRSRVSSGGPEGFPLVLGTGGQGYPRVLDLSWNPLWSVQTANTPPYFYENHSGVWP